MANLGDKSLVWLKGEVKTPPFSDQARLEAGLLLRRLQQGQALSLPHSRPMPAIGRQCHELRITDRDQTWRIVYHVAPDAIVIRRLRQEDPGYTGSDPRSLPKAPRCLLASDLG